VGVKVRNVTSGDLKVKVRLTLASMFYTGVSGKKVKGDEFEVELKADEGKTTTS